MGPPLWADHLHPLEKLISEKADETSLSCLIRAWPVFPVWGTQHPVPKAGRRHQKFPPALFCANIARNSRYARDILHKALATQEQSRFVRTLFYEILVWAITSLCEPDPCVSHNIETCCHFILASPEACLHRDMCCVRFALRIRICFWIQDNYQNNLSAKEQHFVPET